MKALNYAVDISKQELKCPKCGSVYNFNDYKCSNCGMVLKDTRKVKKSIWFNNWWYSSIYSFNGNNCYGCRWWK